MRAKIINLYGLGPVLAICTVTCMFEGPNIESDVNCSKNYNLVTLYAYSSQP